jgi:beta-glucanase (GH16 family)
MAVRCTVPTSAEPFLYRGYVKFLRPLLRIVACTFALAAMSCARAAPTITYVTTPWMLAWSDEFDGPAGARLDTLAWTYQVGDGCAQGICGWGNEEKESYTNDAANGALDGQGHLMIVARRAGTGLSCRDGPCRYTSARLTTQRKRLAQPGRVEARIRIPQGQGLWPAFWMLGARDPDTRWPQTGELDIMENHGSNPRATSSAVHGPGYSGKTPFVHGVQLVDGRSFSTDFHLFAVEWDSLGVRFYVDNNLHHAVSRREVEAHGAWVFDQPFFIILNLAVGGTFDGDPRSDDILPATMLVDYVRVYVPATLAH